MIDRSQTVIPTALVSKSNGGGPRLALWSLSVATIVAAGLVLWNATGPAIFTDMVSAAIAWCF